MQNGINFLLGNVCVEVTGAFPERFLNLCAQEGVGFWGMEQPDEHTLHIWLTARKLKLAGQLAQRSMCRLQVRRRVGLPFFLSRFRHRYALLIGLLVSVCVVSVLSRFILTVEVEGNVNVPTGLILEELKRLGVRPGAYGPGIDENHVCNAALINLNDLSWLSINLHGTRAQVMVRERSPKPKLVDETVPAHVVADASGIILHQEITAGQALFQEGDTVVEGEILVSGIVDLPEPLYSPIDLGILTVRAAGQIYARTWRTLSASIPMTADVKEYTGQEKTLWSLCVMGNRFQISKNGGISDSRYDKIKNNYTLTLPGGREMPLTLTKETLREYEVAAVEINMQSAEDLLRKRLEKRLEELMGEKEGTVLRTEFSAVRRDGLLTVTMLAECTEQIGQTLEFEGTVGHSREAVPEGET